MKHRIVVMVLGGSFIAGAVFLLLVAARAVAQNATIHESPHKRLSRSCETCHVATSFTDIRFDHKDTRFPLESNHVGVACLSCHSIEDFSKVEKSCATCHDDVHRGRLGMMCERCHTPGGWTVFDAEDIHGETNFPVMGRHALLDCESCHRGIGTAEFHQARSQCVDCHEKDYLTVPSPNHVAGGFSRRCMDCHQVLSWRPASMTDHDPFFPIFSGTHRGHWDACEICHDNPANHNVFSCLNCHDHNQGLMDPGHQGMSGYAYASASCYSCHPTGEAGAFVDHDAQFFPIFSGKHRSQWDECAMCHTDPSNRQVYTCLNCHEHSQPLMDPAHQGMSGYAYTSTACYSCHPTGEKGDFVDHDAQFFPIFSGKHRDKWDGDCAVCHSTPADRAIFTCFNCHAHDQNKMDDKHLGQVAGYAYDSNKCLECHPDGRKE